MVKRLSALLLMVSFQAVSSQLIIRMEDQSPVVLTDHEIITQFESTTFETQLPWFENRKSFTGIKVTDLIEFYQLTDVGSISFLGLNDYMSTSQINDIRRYQPIIAYEIEHEKIKVRNKGPYWLIFDLEKYPEIDDISFHSQMVWQIKEIIFHKADDATQP